MAILLEIIKNSICYPSPYLSPQGIYAGRGRFWGCEKKLFQTYSIMLLHLPNFHTLCLTQKVFMRGEKYFEWKYLNELNFGLIFSCF